MRLPSWYWGQLTETKGFVGSTAEQVEGLGQRLLPDPALAQDQERLVVGRDLLQPRQELDDLRRVADDLDGPLGAPNLAGKRADPLRGGTQADGLVGAAAVVPALAGSSTRQIRCRFPAHQHPRRLEDRHSPSVCAILRATIVRLSSMKLQTIYTAYPPWSNPPPRNPTRRKPARGPRKKTPPTS